MIIHIVDSKCDFKSEILIDKEHKTAEDVINSIIENEILTGKKMISNIGKCRYKTIELTFYLERGLLRNDLEDIANGKVIKCEYASI